jgi:uncharacterized membrane protein YhiD involved in acid resistance
MPSFLDSLMTGSNNIAPADLAWRLILACVFGFIISVLYRTTRSQREYSSFPATLVLLTILIAMVTKVIGDSVARAFSLVGALSIVRFRTAVRDTEDTAYVIFAVVIGMAMGADHLWVPCIGIVVVGIAAFLLKGRRKQISVEPTHTLTVRVGIGNDADVLIRKTLSEYATGWKIQSVSTSKQGLSVDVTYDLSVRSPNSAEAFVKALNRLDGIQSVELQQHDSFKE